MDFFFGEKETLEESNEPSLIKVHWLAHFLFLCSKKKLSMPVYLVLYTIVYPGGNCPRVVSGFFE